jgi:hypothetical protein
MRSTKEAHWFTISVYDTVEYHTKQSYNLNTGKTKILPDILHLGTGNSKQYKQSYNINTGKTEILPDILHLGTGNSKISDIYLLCTGT